MEPVPPLDEDVLDTLVLQLSGGNYALREELVRNYLTDATTQLETCTVAARANDRPAVAAVGHTLRSTSALVGAGPLASLLRELEQCARGTSADLVRPTRRVTAEYARVAASLEALIAAPTVAAPAVAAAPGRHPHD